jgi:hypothetical protein
MMSSSSSRARLRLLAGAGLLFAADMLGRSGELQSISPKALAIQETTYLILQDSGSRRDATMSCRGGGK